METWLAVPKFQLLGLLCAVAALSGSRSSVAAAGRSCADTRQVYAEKGYSTGTAPVTQISGKTLQLTQSYTFCFSNQNEVVLNQITSPPLCAV
uniref:Uncharacterized protein n=1 Tax=Hippocampus comes TaxID=109280 RepID=A0A3Q3DMJ3_HIPCM